MSTPEDGGTGERHPRTSRKVGWSNDIVAPRQEIDTLSRLYEEAAIQDQLSGMNLEPKEFLNAYRKARAAYRSSKRPLVMPSPRNTSKLTSQVALFGTQAAARARRRSKERAIMTCNCPDEPGVLAGLAASITKDGDTIIGAFMSVVAGHLITAFLLSGSRVKHQTILKEHPGMKIDYQPIQVEDAAWPLPGSSYWHASARLRDGESPLLLELTAEIRPHGLVTLSSWLEQEGAVQVVDLNFAIAPGPPSEELEAIRELESRIKVKFKDAHLEMTRVTSPTRYRARGNVVNTSSEDMIVNVIGRADPDFVSGVLRNVGDIDARVDFRACSVGVLDDLTVLTIVLDRTGRISPGSLAKQIAGQIESSETKPVSVSVFRGAHCRRDDASSWPNHELSIHTAEQSRAIAKVAQLLSDFDVNITWFLSQLLDPVVGDRSPVSAIEMHIYVPTTPNRDGDGTRPPQKSRRRFRRAVEQVRHARAPDRRPPEANYDELDARLRTLVDTEGWLYASMSPWSLGDVPADTG